MESEVETTEESSLESMVDIGVSIGYPFALRAAVLLNVPKIIQSAGPEAALSAKEICTHLTNPERASSVNLEKILEILSCYNMLSSTAVEENDETKTTVRKYGLTSLSRVLAADDSIAGDAVVFVTAPEMIKMWPNIHESVLNPDDCVFEKAYGKAMYHYMKEDAPELCQFQIELMQKTSAMHLKLLLKSYDELFKGFTGTLVDVGGSRGTIAATIASKYPNIERVINFDLPHVVNGAPAYRGVEHVGGSFLDFVPQGDMLFMKFVLANWSDEELVKIMQNCYQALPAKGGKLIIVDKVLRDVLPQEKKTRLRTAFQDMLATMAFRGSKSRTLKEHQAAAEAAGFASLRLVKYIDTLTIMEAEKAPQISN